MSNLPSALLIPDPLLAKGATDILREYSTDLLFNHSIRVYLFAAEQGRQSLSRAATVVTLLKRRGVDPDFLAVRGAGPLEPLAEGNTEAARSANRRVSFTVGTE